MDDPEYRAIVEQGLADGHHRNPFGLARDYFTTAYLHHPVELRRELATAGFQHLETFAVEGPAWLLGDLGYYLEVPERTGILMRALQALETQPSLLGASNHLLAVGRKAT